MHNVWSEDLQKLIKICLENHIIRLNFSEDYQDEDIVDIVNYFRELKRQKSKQNKLQRLRSRQKSYRKLSIQRKNQIVCSLNSEIKASQQNPSKIIKRFSEINQINSKNLSRWLQHQVLTQANKSGRKPSFIQLQVELCKRLHRKGEWRKREIKRMAFQIESEAKNQKGEKFRFSHGWYEKFKLRHYLKTSFQKFKLPNSQIKTYTCQHLNHFSKNTTHLNPEDTTEIMNQICLTADCIDRYIDW